jgi:hypothetical protein
VTEPLATLPFGPRFLVTLLQEARKFIVSALSEALNGHESGHVEKPVTAKEFAEFLGVDEKCVRALISEGMPAWRTSPQRGIRITASKAVAWLEERGD